MGLFNRRMTVEVSQDAGGPVFMISGATDDPCRRLIVDAAADILQKHGRWEEETNFRASNNWGPLLHGDITETAPQPFSVPVEPAVPAVQPAEPAVEPAVIAVPVVPVAKHEADPT